MNLKKLFSVLLSAVVFGNPLTGSYVVHNVIAENADIKNTEINDMSVKSTNSFGDLVVSQVEQELNEQSENNGCKIYSVEMNGNTAEVSFNTSVSCSLIVAIYDDSGEKMLLSASTEVSGSISEVELTFENENIPENFYLRAYLVDSENMSPLCSVYENPNYTSSMKEFFSKTADDFDAEKVLNFDDDTTNNFAVYSDSVSIIESNQSNNILSKSDDANGEYVFENIDETISSLQADDIFTYETDNQAIIVKIAEINIDGTTATITATETSLDEVFEYVRVEETLGQDDAEFDTDGIDNVVYSDFEKIIDDDSENSSETGPILQGLPKKASAEYDEDVDVNFDDGKIDIIRGRSIKISFEKEDKYDNNEIKDDTVLNDSTVSKTNSNVVIKNTFSGELTYKSDLSLKIYIFDSHKGSSDTTHGGGGKDFNGESSDINYFEVKWAQSLDIDVSLESKTTATVSLFKIKYAFKGFVIEWIPKFIVEASGKINLNGTFSETLGYKVTNKGTENISEKPKFNADVKIEGEFAVGIDLGPTFYFISDFIAKVDTEASVKIKIKATTSLLEFEYELFGDEPKDKHDCLIIDDNSETGCLDGQIDGIIALSAEGKLFNSDKLKLKIGTDITVHLFDFYYSLKNKELGKGECPHKQYYYNLTVNDRYGEPVNETEVSVLNAKTKAETSYITDDKGKATVYLTPGNNSVTLEKEKFNKSTKSFNVSVTRTTENSVSASGGYDYKKDEEITVNGTTTQTTAATQNASTETTTAVTTTGPSIDIDLGLDIELGSKEEVVKINNKTDRDGTVELDPVMYPVKVKVIDKDGNDVNASFKTSYEFDNNIHTDSVLGNSSYTLSLPEGMWDITAIPKASYYEEQTQSVTVQEDSENLEITFIFEDNRAGATIILKDQYGDPVSDASVNIEKVGEPQLVGTLPTTDENGMYTKNLSEGDYTITVKKDGYDTVTDTFTVGEEPVNVEIIMQNNGEIEDTTKNDNIDDTQGEIIDSGECGAEGDNVKWELYENGTLRIYGTGGMGGMFGYNDYTAPWFLKKDYIKEVIIEDGVTSIVKYAFDNCTSLTSITIPESVTSIGVCAFFNCISLTEVIIPDSVTSIGDKVFYYCMSLTKITIPDSVTSIGDEAFYHCTNLAEIMIPDSVTSIGAEAFYSCTGLTEITISDSVISIGKDAFSRCKIDTLIIADGSQTINSIVYYLRLQVRKVIIPNSITNIDSFDFDGCIYLTEITIPDSVTNIGTQAFSGCICLTEIIIPDGVTNIGKSAFYNCSNLKEVTISDSVKSIGAYAFGNCKNLTDVYYTGTEEAWSNIEIADGSYSLENATIHYNSTGAVPAPTPAPPAMKLDNVSVLAEETTAKTAEFADLKPNTVYNFYSMKSREAENPLSAENLLYISQAVSDENGNMNISYIPKEESETSEEFVADMIYDIKYADVTTENYSYTGEEITPAVTVKYNGNILAEGTDYEISVPEKPVEPGAYTVLVSGMGSYYGDKAVSFAVVCKHEYIDGICSICGQTESTITTTTTTAATTTSETIETTTTTSTIVITERKLGDVNGDNMVDAVDASLILQEYAILSTGGSGNFTDIQKSVADINGDGMTDAVDASLVLQYYAYVSTGGKESSEEFFGKK